MIKMYKMIHVRIFDISFKQPQMKFLNNEDRRKPYSVKIYIYHIIIRQTQKPEITIISNIILKDIAIDKRSGAFYL